ncbi:MAG: hypothetical protein ACREQ8_00505, partial [Woeseiaceae bacterium]
VFEADGAGGVRLPSAGCSIVMMPRRWVPAFALERLDSGHLLYESVKPGPGGSVSVLLTLLELIDRLAALAKNQVLDCSNYLICRVLLQRYQNCTTTNRTKS